MNHTLRSCAGWRLALACAAGLSFVAPPAGAAPDGWEWRSHLTDPLLKGMRCADYEAQHTGIGLRRLDTAAPRNDRELFIFMDGGGVCWTFANCFPKNDPDHLGGAANVYGYGPVEFDNERKLREYVYLDASALSRNPFKRMAMAFIPYCTGDTHSGTRTGGYPNDTAAPLRTYFAGQTNLQHALDYLSREFPDVDTVWLMGTSAGGIGANHNYAAVRNAFSREGRPAQVHLIEDSSPGFPELYGNADRARHKNWGIVPSCDGCDTEQQVRQYNRGLDPTSRYAFLSFRYDKVTRVRMLPDGHLMTAAEFEAAMQALRDGVIGVNTNRDALSKFFTVDEAGRTLGGCRSHVVTKKTLPETLMEAHLAFLTRMTSPKARGWHDYAFTLPYGSECPSDPPDPPDPPLQSRPLTPDRQVFSPWTSSSTKNSRATSTR